jgi:hypothetical protein
MPAHLLALTDGPSILLDKPIMLLGRHPECDIQLNSRKVSRRHCCIAQVQEHLVVRDLGSTNGIRINGNSVPDGKLKAGDELTIGNFKYRVCWELPGEPLSLPKREVVNKAGAQPVRDPSDSADEPVPLDENAAVSRILMAKPANPKSTRAASAGTISDDILPDDLDLIPPSSIQNRPGG